MSKAGIQSNRGDGYQTLVAFDWALTVLSDPDYQWLEVDSVTLSVDDVVIGKADGTKIGCQCKKNQTQHRAWSFADIKDELRKAVSLLTNDPKAKVRFYSRSSFGDLAALREFSTNYANESTYQANLTKAHKKTDTELTILLAEEKPVLSTYQFLQRTRFEVSPELDRMRTLLRERLRQLVSNHSAAYEALWTYLDHLGMRENGDDQSIAPRHRLTKEDLKALLTTAGSMLTPSMEVGEVRTSFTSTSAIGRSWRRDIGNEYITNPVVSELLEAIEAKHRSILVTGLPGSGKTCVMLSVQDELEQLAQNRTDLLPLFIQSREFADTVTEQERRAQGLPEHWVERAARMAEEAHVVVIIDSLDVLSIAREHSILKYFLAQIDRLLLIPNVTVVTACRDFDSQYDRHIAQRSWDKKVTCQPLDWPEEIAPLLTKLGIDTSAIDATTRTLISNPRELALFVELAQQGGSFNIVTSQALAQRYLATIVTSNRTLGDVAMQAIESIADEMLRSRRLAVPHQRFSASPDIKRALLSNKVLHETQDGQLTFGHQTLLDVLVISKAIRQAVTLNEFIQQLPAVPFVRPCIRSFVAQLAIGERRDLLGQLRTVLTGNSAFHIRRLVAETFVAQVPHDDVWPLLRDLRNQHNEIFQVIYTQADRLEWHRFWMAHLLPALKMSCDTDGLSRHAHRVSRWHNADPVGVSAFWTEVLMLDAVDKNRLANAIAHVIPQVEIKHLPLYRPLLTKLLELPKQQHSFLGHALAYCVTNGVMEDAVLWKYIAGEVSDEDVLSYRFDNKLRCQPHEFGNSGDTFLANRMQESTALLDLAVTSIERWNQVKSSHYGKATSVYWHGFLHETSYKDRHTENDLRHVDSERILFDAVEAAIIHHANTHSIWWQSNRKRLSVSTEGALRYFVILACTVAPHANLDVIGSLLCDKVLLESDLSYELGTLLQAAFLHLDMPIQNAIQEIVLTVHLKYAADLQRRVWMLEAQAQLILTIPCHLRSADAQAILDESEKAIWPLVRQPHIGLKGGIVQAPFSFKVFLDSSDNGVLLLLKHYDSHERNSFDDLLIGGEREVGWQLRDAASCAPSRFMHLLSANGEQISDGFRDDIMEGIANYLAHRYGSLRPNKSWLPEDEPDAAVLARQILNELENNPKLWSHKRSASKAIQSCAHVVIQVADTERLVALAKDFLTLQEESSFSGNTVDLLTTGINMARGNAAEALMILANRLEQNSVPWPESLPNALRQFAKDDHPAIRALLLQRIPYLQSQNPELGWELFGLAMRESSPGLWAIAAHCLYYAYHQKFDVVAPWLARIYREGSEKDFEVWGRISALAALSKRLDFADLLAELNALKSKDAWRGATSVWIHTDNIQQHREQCLDCLEAGLNAENIHAATVAHKFLELFREVMPLTFVPIELIRRCFRLLETEIDSAHHNVFGFDAWLNANSLHDPMYALEAAEIYLDFARQTKTYVYNHENNLTQLLTQLFAQAEEQEESDNGVMLQRVVKLQDALLVAGVHEVNDWLKAAERP